MLTRGFWADFTTDRHEEFAIMTKQDTSMIPHIPESYATFWTTSLTTSTSSPATATADRSYQRSGIDAYSEFVNVTEEVILTPPILRK
jgi:hypothetical protein